MTEEKTPLEELEFYLGIEYNSMEILSRRAMEGVLERTVRALEAGATTEDIRNVFAEYITAWQPDRTYG